jgi:FixJ family two-component response regulator
MATRILLIDDDLDTLRTYKKALFRSMKAQEVQLISTGKIIEPIIVVEDVDTVSLGLQKLRTQPFEIVVVDLKIPGLSGEEMGGLELISESLALDPLRPIIAVTGYGTIELARKTFTQGVFDFIEKSTTAVDDLINAIKRAISYLDEKIKRSGNPFTPMTGLEPTIFGGRAKELEFFEQRLNRAIYTKFCEHFLVLGDWGIGKSTLLKEYKKICQSRGYLASVIPLESLQSGTRTIEAARSIVEGILRDLPYQLEQFKKVLHYFDSIGISILGTGFQFKRDTSKRELSSQAFLHDTLMNLWKDIEDKTEVFLVLLDDLDNFIAVPEILMTLKQTLSMESIRKTKILVGLASTYATWQELTSLKMHHPLSRYFLSRIELGPLTQSELEETVHKSLAETGVSFSTEVIQRVFEYTEGHPFEMQVLCYHLFNNQISRQVGVDIWEKALQSAINDMGIATFRHWFDQASSEEAEVLCIIAKSANPISVRDIQKMGEATKLKISSKSIAKYLKRLVEKKLIKKSGHGLYFIQDRMFRAFICFRSSPS